MTLPPIRRLVSERDVLRRERDFLAQKLSAIEARYRELLEINEPKHGGSSIWEVVNPARYQDPEWLALHHDLER